MGVDSLGRLKFEILKNYGSFFGLSREKNWFLVSLFVVLGSAYLRFSTNIANLPTGRWLSKA
jgi:hypothetical protein